MNLSDIIKEARDGLKPLIDQYLDGIGHQMPSRLENELRAIRDTKAIYEHLQSSMRKAAQGAVEVVTQEARMTTRLEVLSEEDNIEEYGKRQVINSVNEAAKKFMET